MDTEASNYNKSADSPVKSVSGRSQQWASFNAVMSRSAVNTAAHDVCRALLLLLLLSGLLIALLLATLSRILLLLTRLLILLAALVLLAALFWSVHVISFDWD
jgi:uncharacterized membrane protein